MAIQIYAFHWLSDYAEQFLMAPIANINNIVLGETHKQLPYTFEVDGIGDTTEEINEVLERAFDEFNWQTKDRGGVAPKEVNEFCHRHEVHTCQAVGDVVQIVGVGWWLVNNMGFHKIKVV